MNEGPIGVFDSGIGGLSVLRALLDRLPMHSFDYFADCANAPYGERDPGFIIERSLYCARQLIETSRCKALVVACNSATSAAIANIRNQWPQIPIVGLEPPVKPAAELSLTRRIAVMATKATLGSSKFSALAERIPSNVILYRVPCDGLAVCIEEGDFARAEDIARRRLLDGVGGAAELDRIDCIALGCTHYPLAASAISRAAPRAKLIDPALGAALRCRELVSTHNISPPERHRSTVSFHIFGDIEPFKASAIKHLPPKALAAEFSTVGE